jgi:hypothetical protein
MSILILHEAGQVVYYIAPLLEYLPSSTYTTICSDLPINKYG